VEKDKALASIHGRSMLETVWKALNSSGIEHIFVVGRTENPTSLPMGVIPDTIAGKGPLAGILAALSHSKSDINMIISCDVPFITDTFIRELVSSYDREFEIAIAVDDSGMHPLVGIYQKEVLNRIKSLLDRDHLAMKELIQESEVQYIDVTKFKSYTESQLANINTKEELLKWSQV
jgi:molybdopterin-guanine dinucleotide biosynthesis protein A